MSTTSSENSEVKIYQADKSLQSKIGTGTIAHELIERSQRVMDENNVILHHSQKNIYKS